MSGAGTCADCGAAVERIDGVMPVFCPGPGGAGNCAAYCSDAVCERVPCSDEWHREHCGVCETTLDRDGSCPTCQRDARDLYDSASQSWGAR